MLSTPFAGLTAAMLLAAGLVSNPASQPALAPDTHPARADIAALIKARVGNPERGVDDKIRAAQHHRIRGVFTTELVNGTLRVIPHTVSRANLSATVHTLAADPRTLTVDIDAAAHITGTTGQVTSSGAFTSAQWPLAALSAQRMWNTSTGTGVTVAVIDSGVQATHPDLAGQVLPGKDWVTGTGDGTADGHGHGTHVAGIIAATGAVGTTGLAPGAKILPLRVLDNSGSGWDSDVISAMIYAVDNGADIINLSLGSPAYDDAEAAAVTYATAHNTLVVAAAGNDRGSGNRILYPGGYAGAFTVAATDSLQRVADFSTTGPQVDIAAPGVNILSTYLNGQYAYMSGTSMATPYASAAAALLLSRERAAGQSPTVDSVETKLRSSAIDIDAPGRDDASGWGLINPVADVCADGCPTTPVTATPSPSAGTPAAPAPSQPTAGSVPPTATTVVTVSAGPGIVAVGKRTRMTVTVSAAGLPVKGVDVQVTAVTAASSVVRHVVTDSTGVGRLSVAVTRNMTVSASVAAAADRTSGFAAVQVWAKPKLHVTYSRTRITARSGSGHTRVVFYKWSPPRHRWVARMARTLKGHRITKVAARRGTWRVTAPATAATVEVTTAPFTVSR